MRRIDPSSLEAQIGAGGSVEGGSELRVIGEIAWALWRAKWLLAGALLAGGVAAYVLTRGIEERYSSTTMVMLDTRVPSEGTILPGVGALPPSITTIESELEVLRSLDLVEQVVNVLHLESDPEFNEAVRPADGKAPARWSVVTAVDFLKSRLPAQEKEATADPGTAALIARRRVIDAVAERRSVELLNTVSAVYAISFSSVSREKAARIANAFAEQYLASQTTAKIEALERATAWLAARTSEVEGSLAELNDRLLTDQFEAPFATPEEAQEAHELRSMISRRLDSARASGAGTNELETSLHELTRELQAQARYEAETARLENEVRVAETVYSNFISQLSLQRQQDKFLQSDARIIAQARPPILPSEPNRKLLAATGALLSAMLAAAGVILRELAQRRLRSVRDYEEVTSLPILGMAPRAPFRRSPLRTLRTGAPADESLVKCVRKLRASIDALGSGKKVIAALSALPREGKTSTLLMLAQVCARDGEKVLLLDLDFWHSPYPRRASTASFREMIERPELLDAQVTVAPQTKLHVLSSGLGSPEEMMVVPQLSAFIEHVRQRYDRVLVDMPPVLPRPDFAVAAGMADATLLMVRWNATPTSAVRSALHVLYDLGIVPVGVVATLVAADRAHRYADDAFAYSNKRYLSSY